MLRPDRRAFGERASQGLTGAELVRVVAERFTGRDDMGGVMKIIVPLGGVAARPPVLVTPQIARRLSSFSSTDRCAARRSTCSRTVAAISSRIIGLLSSEWHGRIKAQAVEAVLLKPIERVVDHEVAHPRPFRHRVVDCLAQGVWKRSVKKPGGVAMQVVPARSE